MANNMVTADVRIKGTRPLWFHVFTRNAIPLERQERAGVAGNNPDEWRTTYRASREGQLYLAPEQVFSMMRDAATYTKRGRASIKKYVVATLQVPDDRIYLDRYVPVGAINGGGLTEDSDSGVYLDIRGCRNPSTGQRNIRYRVACSAGWEAGFHLLWDKTIVSESEMRAVLEDASLLVGIGNGRNIGMGRFRIEDFKTVDGAG